MVTARIKPPGAEHTRRLAHTSPRPVGSLTQKGSVDGDLARLGGLGLRQRQPENAVLVGRGDLVRLHRIGQAETALERERLPVLLARGAKAEGVVEQLD